MHSGRPNRQRIGGISVNTVCCNLQTFPQFRLANLPIKAPGYPALQLLGLQLGYHGNFYLVPTDHAVGDIGILHSMRSHFKTDLQCQDHESIVCILKMPAPLAPSLLSRYRPSSNHFVFFAPRDCYQSDQYLQMSRKYEMHPGTMRRKTS